MNNNNLGLLCSFFFVAFVIVVFLAPIGINTETQKFKDQAVQYGHAIYITINNDKDKQFVWLRKGDTEPVLEKYERHNNEQQ
jgi:hypothetical protein